eukprot:1017684-Pelagomonas_calceolata.AAC.9
MKLAVCIGGAFGSNSTSVLRQVTASDPFTCRRALGFHSTHDCSHPMSPRAQALQHAVGVFRQLYEPHNTKHGTDCDKSRRCLAALQENAVGVSRQLYELHDLLGNFEEAAKYAEAALRSMQGLSGMKVRSGCCALLSCGTNRPTTSRVLSANCMFCVLSASRMPSALCQWHAVCSQ